MRKQYKTRGNKCHINGVSDGYAFAPLVAAVVKPWDTNPRVITVIPMLEHAFSQVLLGAIAVVIRAPLYALQLSLHLHLLPTPLVLCVFELSFRQQSRGGGSHPPDEHTV